VAEEAARQPAVCTRQAVLLRSLQSSEETWAQLAAATGECEETAGNDLLGQTLLLRSSKGSSNQVSVPLLALLLNQNICSSDLN